MKLLLCKNTYFSHITEARELGILFNITFLSYIGDLYSKPKMPGAVFRHLSHLKSRDGNSGGDDVK